MARKKKSKSMAMTLYRPPLPAVIPPRADPDGPGSPDNDLLAEWGRDLLRIMEEITPDCRLPPDERKAGRWRSTRED